MKSAILGLRKRETYDELINDLSHDPIGKYPDRVASQLENSNYLSQLRGGIEQMIIQNDNIMRQKQKELLLQEEAGSHPHSHHEHVISESRWRHHVPPPPHDVESSPGTEILYTPSPPPYDDESMPGTEINYTPLRVPVGPPQEYAPDHYTPEEITKSRSSRKYTPKHERNKNPDTPIIQDATEVFHMGTPRSRSPRKGRKSKLAHDVDSEAEQAHEMMVDDEEMRAARNEQLKELYVEVTKQMLQNIQNQSIDDIMTGRGDKRREENANPNPPQAKAKTASWSPAGHTRWTKDEPIPKAPPPKASRGRPPNQPEAEPKASPPKEQRGRGRPPNQPEAEPKSTPASSSRDTPYAKAQAAAKAAAEEPSRSKAIPVKKEPKPKPKHETEKVVLDTYDEWFKKGVGFLMDQLSIRKLKYDIYFPNPPNSDPKKPQVKKPKKLHKPEIIDMLLKFDGKM